MNQLWIVLCEIGVKPGDLSSGSTLAFTNIVTWAEDPKGAQEKVKTLLTHYGWALIGCEEITSVQDEAIYSDELNDLIDQALGNPDAILYSTFHSYRPN